MVLCMVALTSQKALYIKASHIHVANDFVPICTPVYVHIGINRCAMHTPVFTIKILRKGLSLASAT